MPTPSSRLLSGQVIPSHKIDMRIGNPSFLKNYWKTHDYVGVHYDSNLCSSMDYEKEGGRESLKRKILELHKLVRNAKTIGKTLVIGNGATQVINATIYAYKTKYGLSQIAAQAPHWFRFPEMGSLQGMNFSQFDMIMKNWPSQEVAASEQMFLNIITCPSNPENKTEGWTKTKYTIWDLCYNWPQYTDVKKIDEDVMIFSLSKATGHGASRIGWGLYSDPEIADLIQKYIEFDTGGVSVEAQTRAEHIIQNQLSHLEKRNFDLTCFSSGGKILKSRWDKLKQLGFLSNGGHRSSKIQMLNNSGMFAWCAYLKEDENLVKTLDKKFDLLVLDGKGSDSFSRNKFRMNIGCDDETFSKFLKKFT